jgi:hypothetical protein
MNVILPPPTDLKPKRRPRPLQFSLRTMFLVVTAFGFLCGLTAWQGFGVTVFFLAACCWIGFIVGICKRSVVWIGGCAAGLCLLLLLLLLYSVVVDLARQNHPRPLPNQLKTIGHAVHCYHDHYKCFPPAYVADEDGNPMHSWRVLLLPYLELDALYEEYDFSEPWDGPNNRKLAGIALMDFNWGENFQRTGGLTTGFVVVVGDDTAFPGDKSRNFTEIGDGTSQTITVVACANSGIHWMEPRDLEFDRMSFRINDPSGKPGIRAVRVEGAWVCFADGSAHFLDKDCDPEVLKGLLRSNDGKGLPEGF